MAQAIEALDNLIKEGSPIRNKKMAKGGIFGAFLKKSRMKRETARKKRYLQHYKKAGKSAMTYAQWIKEGEASTYYKGAGGKRRTVEAQLREAGIDPKRFKRKK